jgi:predicted kinase
VELNPNTNSEARLKEILANIKRVINLCTLSKEQGIIIISSDHIRKLYRDGKPNYSTWENTHTYDLAKWLIRCILQKKKSSIVVFDATNLNRPSRPSYREKLFSQFKRFNPIFVHLEATEEEAKLNITSRNKEGDYLSKSDADLEIYYRYEEILTKFPDALAIPVESKIVRLRTRSQTYSEELENLVTTISNNNHRLLILSGNVLTGKTYTARRLKELFKPIFANK